MQLPYVASDLLGGKNASICPTNAPVNKYKLMFPDQRCQEVAGFAGVVQRLVCRRVALTNGNDVVMQVQIVDQTRSVRIAVLPHNQVDFRFLNFRRTWKASVELQSQAANEKVNFVALVVGNNVLNL